MLLKELLLILALCGPLLARCAVVSRGDDDYDAYIDIPFKRIKTSVSVPSQLDTCVQCLLCRLCLLLLLLAPSSFAGRTHRVAWLSS